MESNLFPKDTTLIKLIDHIFNAYKVEFQERGVKGVLSFRKLVNQEISKLEPSLLNKKTKSISEINFKESFSHLECYKGILTQVKFTSEVFNIFKGIITIISKIVFIPFFFMVLTSFFRLFTFIIPGIGAYTILGYKYYNEPNKFSILYHEWLLKIKTWFFKTIFPNEYSKIEESLPVPQVELPVNTISDSNPNLVDQILISTDSNFIFIPQDQQSRILDWIGTSFNKDLKEYLYSNPVKRPIETSDLINTISDKTNEYVQVLPSYNDMLFYGSITIAALSLSYLAWLNRDSLTLDNLKWLGLYIGGQMGITRNPDDEDPDNGAGGANPTRINRDVVQQPATYGADRVPGVRPRRFTIDWALSFWPFNRNRTR